MFKVGEKVAVCWDGRIGRICEGMVVANYRNLRILVVFDTYIDDEPAVKWFRVRRYKRTFGGSHNRVGGHYRDAECLVNGWPGAWYSVYTWALAKKQVPTAAAEHTLYTEEF